MKNTLGGSQWFRVVMAVWLFGIVLSAAAGELSISELGRRFPSPLHVQAKLTDVPIWPITSELEPEGGPVAYAFESIDLAPLPGFEGTPFNLLIAIDRKGNFLSVEVLREHEPVFLGGLGEEPLRQFVTQYAGKNIRQEISIASSYSSIRHGQAGVVGNRVVLDGVTKATASIRILNQTVLASALAVARAKLGFTVGGKRGLPAQARSDVYEALSFDELLRKGMLARLLLSNAEAEKLFAGTEGARVDGEGLAHPSEPLVELYVAYLNAPSIGRALLCDAGWKKLMGKLDEGQQALWIASNGRYSMVDESFVPGGVPQRLSLFQDELSLELRDLVFDFPPPSGAPPLMASQIFTVYAGAGLDPGRAMEIRLLLLRSKGMILPQITQQTASLTYAPPESLFSYPPRPLPEWLLAWKARWLDLSIIAAALALLSLALTKPRWLSIKPRRLQAFRWSFLSFTLVYLGWYAQGQLSIVQITGAVKTLSKGQSLSSFLYDPVSLLLILFSFVTFFVWGRGPFCGWLCPFGALQEFIGEAARRLRLPQWRPPARIAKPLATLRYVLLATLVLGAAVAPRLAESLVEAEPFKTAITVGFDRSWPFVAYAAALLLAGAFYYKFFCRFICPLGAAMTLGGKLRKWDWLPRRDECGKPCQTCRSRCAYDAIAPDGGIRYDECFQCLDCVGIYHDPQRCAPQILFHRKGRVVTPYEVQRQRKQDAPS